MKREGRLDKAADLSVELAPKSKAGLRLANPVIAASGTFGYGTEYASIVDVQRLGAIICKGITLRPRKGNPGPRTCETPAGLLNSIGLQNPGARAVIREKAPLWASWSVPVLVNIAGETAEEFARLASLLDSVEGVSGLEVNISCPNVEIGGLEIGTDMELAAEVTRAVRAATSLPLMVKLTPNVTDVVEIAEAVAEAGADCISLVNTFLGMAIDVQARRPVLGRVFGGLSGPAIKPLALRMVYQVAQAVEVPVVGCGGISGVADALEFLMAGASAVQVGTATFVRPQTMLEIVDGLAAWMEREGVHSLGEIVGAALPTEGPRGAAGRG